MKLFNFYKHLLYLLPAELSHNIAVFCLKNSMMIPPKKFEHSSLKQNIAGIEFLNPIGLAAGFDKNAEMIRTLANFNFGFLEVGTVTPKSQLGNNKPRLFRLKSDKAIINRMGFNNVGAKKFRDNFCNNYLGQIPIGINIGKNKLTESEITDYSYLVEYFYDLADYITINISSPNTPGLRTIQTADKLDKFIATLTKQRDLLGHKNLFLKIAPDLSDIELNNICKIALKYQINALIIANTTISRDGLKNQKLKSEMGGLSGKPVFVKSNQILAKAYQILQGKIPIIGVGGISNATDAYHKIKLGANLVQIYSTLIYEGLNLATEINKDLVQFLQKDGFSNIAEAVGSANN